MNTKKIVSLVIFATLAAWVGATQAASIAGSAGMTTLNGGPTSAGAFFTINVNYEAFDGKDASDPLGVTSGKIQFAYILEYAAGNSYMVFFDLESVNAVPLIETGISINGIVNGVSPGTIAPAGHVIWTPASGNQAARYIFLDEETEEPTFGLAGTKSVILSFTVSEEYGAGSILAQATNHSLSEAGEVVGPATQCRGAVEGFIFCLDCGSNNEIEPMEGVTVKVMNDGNEVGSAQTLSNGQYIIPGISAGDYTVVAGSDGLYSPCSVNSAAVTVTCEEPAFASFCLCPIPCRQKITVRVVCDQTGIEVPVPKAWVGITGPNISKRWMRTRPDGTVTFKGKKVVPGAYTITVKAPKGYEIDGSSTLEFDLAECESKVVTLKACPIPPCTQTVCVTVMQTPVCGDSNSLTPIEGVNITLNCTVGRKGVTDASGQICFNDVELGAHTLKVIVPEDYRLCDGDDKVKFSLARCDQKSFEFVLTTIQLGPCPKMPKYWKSNPDIWPEISFMWIGADELPTTQLMNILNGKLPDGSKAKSSDISVDLAKYLIATKLSIAAGSDVKDIEPVVIAADEFLLYDYPPGSCPTGPAKELARDLQNKLVKWLRDCGYCQN